MSVEKTLLRVDADLSAGDLTMACQRLRGLVGSFPDRLDLRARLAQVYRLQGNLAQAGRWGYLADDRHAAEVAAFEKLMPSPLHRMRALAWAKDPNSAPTAAARQRLTTVLHDARRSTGDDRLTYERLRTAGWMPPEPETLGDRVLPALVLFVLVVLLLLFVVGVLDGVRVVWSWHPHRWSGRRIGAEAGEGSHQGIQGRGLRRSPGRRS